MTDGTAYAAFGDDALVARWHALADAGSPDLRMEADRVLRELRRRFAARGRAVGVEGLGDLCRGLGLSLALDLAAALPRHYASGALPNCAAPYALFSKEEVARALDAAERGMGLVGRMLAAVFGSPFADARRTLSGWPGGRRPPGDGGPECRFP